ncbi:MAG: glycosyltransferase [Clostridiales bacterium]|nr:glycosyltransferase [Clostridiales bacterium]
MTETENQMKTTKSNFISCLYLNSKNPVRSAYFWNMAAAMTSSFQSMLFMLVLTRFGEIEAASYIAIGFAAANLAMTVGKFGVRNFQVTDVSEKYCFRAYKNMRYLTVAGMLAFSLVYCVFNVIYRQYVPMKTATVALLCIYKAIESMEDVWHGRLQQLGRLDISAKIWATRNIIFIVEFIVCYMCLGDLIQSLVISIATTLVLCIFLNRMPRREYRIQETESTGMTKALLIECIPVAYATFLLMYISNAPKYIIDSAVSDQEQTYFNILFMVIYVVTLLSNFMFNPVLNRMAHWRERGEYRKLRRRVLRLIAMVAGIVILGTLFAEVIGRRLLGWIYGVSLENYRVELDLMMVAGGLIAILNLLYMIIILLRRQAIFYVLFTAVSLILLSSGRYFLRLYELKGLCCFYIAILFAADIVMFFCVIRLIRKESRDKQKDREVSAETVHEEKKLSDIVAGKKVLFISTKNRDYIRNLQEIRILKENAGDFKEIVFSDKSYPKRVLKVWRSCLGGAWKQADVIFVGFAPQLVFPFLKKWNRRKTVVIDFFISMYDTCVNDRSYFKSKSIPARILHRIDRNVLGNCHRAIVDTAADGAYFSEEFQVKADKMEVLYLEADTGIYDKDKYASGSETDAEDGLTVLYFGSILPLQGVEVILEAQKILKERDDIRFLMIGPVDEKTVRKEDYPNTTFYEWLSQPELAAQIARADLCLAGHFHPTIEKARRTIPGKAYIYEAMEKKMILGDNPANRELYREDDRHLFVKMGDAEALAGLISAVSDER